MSRVSDLFVHPLKGAAPQRVQRLRLDALGAIGDRRWVLVGDDDVQLTAREVPQLLHVRATLPTHDGAIGDEAPLALSYPGRDDELPPLFVPHGGPRAARRAVRLWDDVVTLVDAGDEAAAWCARAVGRPCRLMHIDADSHRPLQPRYAGPLPADGREVAAPDGAPLLLLGVASVEALNARLAVLGEGAVSVARFRPNVVLGTSAPHEEDTWARVRIGAAELGVGSPCPRCVVTTIDPVTLAQRVEPLRTLARYRRDASGGVMFGMNATHAAAGEIVVGDAVTVLAHRS